MHAIGAGNLISCIMTEAARRQRVLRSVEEKLIRALADCKSKEKIHKAAEAVRSVMISLFKGQREIVIYKEKKSESEINHLQNIERKTEEWKLKAVQEIVRAYDTHDV